MSEVHIRRGSASRLSVKPKRSTPARGRGKSRIDRLLANLPISHATLHRALSWTIAGAVIGAAASIAVFFGLPGMVQMELAELAARAGYEVKKVEVTGTRQMDEQQVYSIALGEVDRSMLTVNLSELRQKLLELPWVGDARVARRLPDTLAIDIVERKPAAVWQNQGQLALIDATGVVLEAVSVNAMPNLPLLVGEDANLQAARLSRLMEAAPALKPVIQGATWVGNRRWDLRFQSGETLSLPEGDESAASALVNFARLDGINRLLGRGIRRFDMRDPDKFVLRMPKDNGAVVEKSGSVTPAMEDLRDTRLSVEPVAGEKKAESPAAKGEQG